MLASLTAVVLALTATIVVGATTAAVKFHNHVKNEVQLRRAADAATTLAVQEATAAQVLQRGAMTERLPPLGLSGPVRL